MIAQKAASLVVPGSTLAALTAAAGLAYVALAVFCLLRRPAFARRPVIVALLLTSLWLALAAMVGQTSMVGMIAEAARNLGWLWVMAGMAGKREPGTRLSPIGWIYIGLFTIQALLAAVLLSGPYAAWVAVGSLPMIASLQMLFAAGALVLLHNLWAAGRGEERRAMALLFTAIAMIFAYDLNLYAITYLSGEPAVLLLDFRALAAWAMLAMLAIAAMRPGNKAVRLSRPAAFRSLGLAAVVVWLSLLSILAVVVQQRGENFSDEAQLVILVGGVAIAGLLCLSPRLRAALRVWTAKHFYEHRYDYRSEWLRFTRTLDQPELGGLSIDARVIKAIADIVESRGGVLISRDPADADNWTVTSHWPQHSLSVPAQLDCGALAVWLEQSGRTVQFDEVRSGKAPADECTAVPGWLLEQQDMWIAVPLVHLDQVSAIILLMRPVLDRALDWEDFDLLRTAGRQAASHLAEARGAEALAESVRFDEFHRRFAFVMHDVKNLASQMALLSRNAERHGENPAFREDMVATLRVSSERLSSLMRRLSQQEKIRSPRIGPVDISVIARQIAAERRSIHPVRIDAPHALLARADGDMVEQMLIHLVQNAIDATHDSSPVVVTISDDANTISISIADSGCGMSPEFVRGALFRPFTSTKDAGFGIGAYQARQLAEAMGGALAVRSAEGVGSTFTITLPRWPLSGNDDAQEEAA